MFVQIIEAQLKSEDGWKTIDEMEDDWRSNQARQAPGYVSGQWLRDRKDPKHVLGIIQFESAERAQENSKRAETNQFYQRMLTLVETAPKFIDCDVVH